MTEIIEFPGEKVADFPEEDELKMRILDLIMEYEDISVNTVVGILTSTALLLQIAADDED